MAAADAKKLSKKRKAASEEEAPAPQPSAFPQEVGLEMGSEDEGKDGDEGSDDGEVDDFPEIDARSDTDEEGDDEDDEDESVNEEDEEDEGESDASDDSLHVWPKPKTVISDITGQPKRVYDDIEPDYDSDSSTEDVRPSYETSRPHARFVNTMFIPNRPPIASVTSPCTGTTIYPM